MNIVFCFLENLRKTGKCLLKLTVKFTKLEKLGCPKLNLA